MNDNDPFTKLYLHFQAETNRCGNNFEGRLVKYLTEFGGTVFKILHKGKNQKKFLMDKLERIEELDEANRKILTKASKKIKEAAAIYNKKSKTTEDRIILTANKICKALKFKKLNEDFLEHVRHVKNVDTLVQSFALFDKSYKSAHLVNDNIDKNAQLFAKKCNIVKTGNELFFDNMFGEDTITVEAIPLTKQQSKWFKDNKGDILYCFNNIRSSRVDINTQVDLIKLVNKINSNFFGDWLNIKIDRTRKQVDKKKMVFYECFVNNGSYIELMLNSYQTGQIPNKIVKACKINKDTECLYESLHGNATIGSILQHDQYAKNEADFFVNAVIDFTD